MIKKVEATIGTKQITIETGKLAKQASGSVLVRSGDTMVLVTACAEDDPRKGVDFMPLTVDYREKTSAAGKIPGGFFKREGRPTTKEILACRIIDRSIRPLFADGYKDETQILATVLAADGVIFASPVYVNHISALMKSFFDRIDDVRKLGYPEEFIRMWHYYLLSAAGGFRSRHNQLWQIVMTRQGDPQPECRFN